MIRTPNYGTPNFRKLPYTTVEYTPKLYSNIACSVGGLGLKGLAAIKSIECFRFKNSGGAKQVV